MYKKPLEVNASAKVINTLIAVGYLRWPQRADDMAIGKAIGALLDDITASGLTPAEYVLKLRDEKDGLPPTA